MLFTKFRNFNVAGVGEVVPGAMACVAGAGDIKVVSVGLTIRFHWYIFYIESVHSIFFIRNYFIRKRASILVKT